MKLKRRIGSDKAAAVTILSLALLMLFMLIAVFMVDFVKNTQIRNNYTQIGQRATQAALIHQDGVGGLLPQESANAFVNEYMLERSGKGYDDKGKAIINSKQTKDTAGFRKSSCSNTNEYPKIKIKYRTKRTDASSVNDKNLPTATSIGGSSPSFTTNDVANLFAKKQYKVMSAEITDVSDNYFFGMFGQPCQVYHINVSSVAIHQDND